MNSFIQALNRLIVFLGKVATVAMILPIIVAIANFRYLNRPLKIIFWFSIFRLFVSLITQFIIWVVSTYQNYFVPILNRWDIHNMSFISILAHLNNFGLLGWYFSLIIEDKKIKYIIRLISVFLFITAIINYIFIEGYKSPNVFNSTSSNIFCFLLPLIHLWFLYGEDSKVPIAKNPYFWISLGLIIPNLTGLITSIIGKKLKQTDPALFFQVDIGYAVLQIFGYLLIAIGFYYARYTKYLPQKTTTLLPPQ